MEKLLSFNQNIICTKCSTAILLQDKMFKEYFQTDRVICKKCNNDFNLLDSLISQVQGPFRGFGWHYNIIGCKGNAIKLHLNPNEPLPLDLSSEIKGGQILFVNVTRNSGNLYPIVMSSNNPFPKSIPDKITLIPYTTEKEPQKSTISMLYFYASPKQLDDLSTKLMIEAFKYYFDGDYRNMFISAQTSIEVLQYRFCERLLADNKVSNKQIKSFLEDKVTFSTQAFTLLPLLSECLKFPYPNEKILEGIRNLVKTRNDFVHRGTTLRQINETQLGQILVCSLIFFKYYKVVHNL